MLDLDFKMKRVFIIIVLLFFVVLKNYSQDKLIFKDGTKRNCKIVSVNKSTVTFKDLESSTVLITKSKTEILLAEEANGAVYIFGNEKVEEEKVADKNLANKSKDTKQKKEFTSDHNNMIGSQLFSSFLGRTGLVYERFFNNKQMSIAIPLSVSYSPYSTGPANGSSYSTNSNINFVTGGDLSYFFPTKTKNTQFFIGPRVRYGTDVMMFNITGLSVQAQNGFLFHSMHNPKVAHTLAFGFGFIRIITTPKSNKFDPKQSFPWMSLTYRFNIKW